MTLSHDDFMRITTPTPFTKEELEAKERVRAMKFPMLGVKVKDEDVGFDVNITKPCEFCEAGVEDRASYHSSQCQYREDIEADSQD